MSHSQTVEVRASTPIEIQLATIELLLNREGYTHVSYVDYLAQLRHLSLVCRAWRDGVYKYLYYHVESRALEHLKPLLDLETTTAPSVPAVPRQQRPLNYIHILGLKNLPVPDFEKSLLVLEQLPHLSNLLLELTFSYDDTAVAHSVFDCLHFPEVTCLSLAILGHSGRRTTCPIPISHLISCFPSARHLSIGLTWYGSIDKFDHISDLSPPPPHLISLRFRTFAQHSLLKWLINLNPHNSALRHLDVDRYNNQLISPFATHCGDTLESLNLLDGSREATPLPLSRFSALRNLSTGNAPLESVALEEIQSEQLRRFEFMFPTYGNLVLFLSRVMAFLGRCPMLIAITCHHALEPLAEIDAWAKPRGIVVDWRRLNNRNSDWDQSVSSGVYIGVVLLIRFALQPTSRIYEYRSWKDAVPRDLKAPPMITYIGPR
jgi:hypothetical protein